MSPYTVEWQLRFVCYLAIFLLAFITQGPLAEALKQIVGGSGLLAGSISILALGNLYWFAFDMFLWRYASHLIPGFVPDLNGKWIGYITKRSTLSFDATREETIEIDAGSMIPIEVDINQTFTGIAIYLEDKEEVITQPRLSVCRVVGIDRLAAARPALNYTYSRPDMRGEANLFIGRENDQVTLRGEYLSSYPRRGHMALHRVSSNVYPICAEMRILRSRQGQEYFGAAIASGQIEKFLKMFDKMVADERNKELRARRFERDGAEYHMTIYDPIEFEKLKAEGVMIPSGRKTWIEACGIGKQALNANETYFVVCRADHSAAIRRESSLGRKDFHITLGFSPEDIHGVPKDLSTIVVGL